MTILWRHPTAGRNGPQLRAPGDVPKRTGDTAPPRPVVPVSTVAPASSVAPVSIMAMAPIAPMASILLKQNSRDDGRGWRRAGDARTKANGAEPQCADHRSSGRNLLQIHCQTPFPTPYEMPTLGSLNSCPAVDDSVQSTTKWWTTDPPMDCASQTWLMCRGCNFMRLSTALRIAGLIIIAKAVLIGVVYWRRAEILGRPIHIGADGWMIAITIGLALAAGVYVTARHYGRGKP
jgi:hypothetical protein